MNWVKKSVFGICFAFLLFASMSAFGQGVFSAEFLGIGGFMLLLIMGVTETNLVTYS
jgi:hypothetical protein